MTTRPLAVAAITHCRQRCVGRGHTVGLFNLSSDIREARGGVGRWQR